MQIIPRLILFIGFSLLPILVIIVSSLNYYYDYYFVAQDLHGQAFDFIIVGAGSAGAPLANRLSKNSKVLVLEAGGDPLLWLNSLPGFAIELLEYEQIAWLYKTVPQSKFGHLLENNISKWPRGKILGGTSTLNYMLYLRGHTLDYDNWANLTGDPSWNYENVLPYFKKSLNYRGTFANDKKDYGEGSPYGYMHVENRSWAPFYKYFIDAGKELGYDEKDLNAKQSSGFGPLEATQRNGRRESTFDAFLKDFQSRKNLIISRYSQAVKIKLDENNRAVGIWYFQHGVKRFAKAKREIIICTGTVDSPKLLMLSGIGPEKHLVSVGIKTRVNLPVGKNLQDHPMVILWNILIDKPISFIPERDFGLSAQVDYFIYGKGPLTSPPGVQAQAFITTSHVKQSGTDWPDAQILLNGVGNFEGMHKDISKLAGSDGKMLEDYFSSTAGQDAFSLMCVLCRPKSTGEIMLRDRNPFSDPIINPRYFEDPQDVSATVETLQFAVKLVETTKSFHELNARLAPIPLPPCKHLKFKSSEYFECYARNMGLTMYHPVGTCRMGVLSDPRTVVDSKLRVKGVHGLRVADASIMPVIPNANTNGPTIMIGEKAADIIREYWSQQFLICDKFTYVLGMNNGSNVCYYSQLV